VRENQPKTVYDRTGQPKFDSTWAQLKNEQICNTFFDDERLPFVDLRLAPTGDTNGPEIVSLPHDCDTMNRAILERLYVTYGADPKNSAEVKDVAEGDNHFRSVILDAQDDCYFEERYIRIGEQESFSVTLHRRTDPTEQTGPDEIGAQAHLVQKASGLREQYFTRPVTTFESITGERFRAAANQIDVFIKNPSEVIVKLKTHDKKITMTIGGLLLATGAIGLQRNRSQRKKMSKRDSSYLRDPKK